MGIRYLMNSIFRSVINLKVITENQREDFIEKGWIKVESAIPRETALRAQQELWRILNEKFGITEDSASWEQPFYQLSENYRHGVFRECSTSKLMQAIKELIGEDRLDEGYEKEGIPFGWWPINLRLGVDEEWDVPVGGWHWDGLHFRHYLDSSEQGLLMIVLFSDVKARGGGTLLAEGTHKLVARFLLNYPEGIEYKDAIPLVNRSNQWLAELTNSFGQIKDEDRKKAYYTNQIRTPSNRMNRIKKFIDHEYIDESGVRLKVVETIGNAGDVFLCHPFIYHTGSPNHSGKARLMCNLPTPLNGKMKLYDKLSKKSVLEQSIILALDL